MGKGNSPYGCPMEITYLDMILKMKFAEIRTLAAFYQAIPVLPHGYWYTGCDIDTVKGVLPSCEGHFYNQSK
jgi:hypothetical protein